MALYGGVAGEQLDPCYHEACDSIGTVTGQPPAEHDELYVRPRRNPALAQQQADSLQGNALKSLREMSGAVTHSVWYFGQNRRGVGSRTTADKQRAKQRAAKFQFARAPAGRPVAHDMAGGARAPRGRRFAVSRRRSGSSANRAR